MNRIDDTADAFERSVEERRDPLQPDRREIGRLVSCSGGQGVVSINVFNSEHVSLDFWSIGRLISVAMDKRRIIAVVFEMKTVLDAWNEIDGNTVHFHVELVGEIVDDASGKAIFSRGITSYPNIGAIAHRVRTSDLAAIHVITNGRGVEVGRLTQDHSIPATVDMGEMLSKHFAVVGTTGVGKTTSVALLIRKAVETIPNLRVLILDPHNEYERGLGRNVVSLGAETLELPFWLFTFEELSDVVFRGAEAAEGEKSALMEIIVAAKVRFQAARSGSTTARRLSADEGSNIGVDSPVPYRMADLFSLILDAMGKLEAKHSRLDLRNLKTRLESLCQNYRYRFMFRSTVIEDNIEKVIGQIFRIPHHDKRITVLQLADLPSDVTNSVVSVLARLALDLCVIGQSTYKIALICEEAHRYIPNDYKRGFGPTRHAIARIAKEGRKFGCSIGIVTQRPSEVDSTILSQCSTVFAMRLSNESDQNIIKSAISQSSEGRIRFLSSIRNREAIAFGEAIAMPMRFEFTQMSADMLGAHESGTKSFVPQELDLRSVVQKMRGLDETQRLMGEISGVSSGASAQGNAGLGQAGLANAGSGNSALGNLAPGNSGGSSSGLGSSVLAGSGSTGSGSTSAPLPQAGSSHIYTPGSSQPSFGHSTRPTPKVPGW